MEETKERVKNKEKFYKKFTLEDLLFIWILLYNVIGRKLSKISTEGEKMDKIQLLQERKAKLIKASKDIRARIQEIADEESFVELSAFSFSKNEFYNEDVAGEGVVTGFCTVNGYPFYVVAQNFATLQGGVSKANCDKIVKCLDVAEKNDTPVLYFLHTQGVQVGEGVTVLEGLGKLLMRSTQLKGVVPQYVVVDGEVYGGVAMLAAIADFTFFVEKKSVLALGSPFVLSAKSGKNLTKEEVGSTKALDKTGIPTFEVQELSEVREKIVALQELVTIPMVDAELNQSLPALNQNATAEGMLGVFEEYLELCPTFEKDVKTILGRIGGISVAAVLFDGEEKGVELTQDKLAKIKSFAEFACCYNLPFITFADVKGVCPCMGVNNSRVMKEATEYLDMLDTIDTAKIALVYKRAIGLGYSLFASKSVGFDYTCAFANAKVALFDDVQGAVAELGEGNADKTELAKRYAEENSDSIHAAKDGYIDAIVEPQFVKQHLIAALQMFAR